MRGADNITTVALDVTYNCNLRCRHCFNSSGEQEYGKKMLEKDEILIITRELAQIKSLQSMCFCGGEPLLEKEVLFEGAATMKENVPGIAVNAVTNAMLLDEKTADEIAGSKLSMVQVSLDGFRPEVHNWIRNHEASYERAVAAIKLLRSRKVPVSVASLPTKKKMVEDLPRHIKMLEGLGVFMFRMQPLMLLGRAREHMKEMALSEMEYRKLARYLLKLSSERALNKKMKIEWGDPIQHLSNFKNRNLVYLCINAYGELIVSPYLPVVVGDLKKHSLQEYFDHGLVDVWKSKFIKKLAAAISTWDTMDVSRDGVTPEIYAPEHYVFDLVENRDLFEQGELA